MTLQVKMLLVLWVGMFLEATVGASFNSFDMHTVKHHKGPKVSRHHQQYLWKNRQLLETASTCSAVGTVCDDGSICQNEGDKATCTGTCTPQDCVESCSPCPQGYACSAQRCVATPTCTVNAVCDAGTSIGLICQLVNDVPTCNGVCTPGCKTDDCLSCPQGYECSGQKCLEIQSSSCAGPLCDSGEICKINVDKQTTSCVSCGAEDKCPDGYFCDAQKKTCAALKDPDVGCLTDGSKCTDGSLCLTDGAGVKKCFVCAADSDCKDEEKCSEGKCVECISHQECENQFPDVDQSKCVKALCTHGGKCQLHVKKSQCDGFCNLDNQLCVTDGCESQGCPETLNPCHRYLCEGNTCVLAPFCANDLACLAIVDGVQQAEAQCHDRPEDFSCPLLHGQEMFPIKIVEQGNDHFICCGHVNPDDLGTEGSCPHDMQPFEENGIVVGCCHLDNPDRPDIQCDDGELVRDPDRDFELTCQRRCSDECSDARRRSLDGIREEMHAQTEAEVDASHGIAEEFARSRMNAHVECVGGALHEAYNGQYWVVVGGQYNEFATFVRNNQPQHQDSDNNEVVYVNYNFAQPANRISISSFVFNHWYGNIFSTNHDDNTILSPGGSADFVACTSYNFDTVLALSDDEMQNMVWAYSDGTVAAASISGNLDNVVQTDASRRRLRANGRGHRRHHHNGHHHGHHHHSPDDSDSDSAENDDIDEPTRGISRDGQPLYFVRWPDEQVHHMQFCASLNDEIEVLGAHRRHRSQRGSPYACIRPEEHCGFVVHTESYIQGQCWFENQLCDVPRSIPRRNLIQIPDSSLNAGTGDLWCLFTQHFGTPDLSNLFPVTCNHDGITNPCGPA